MKNKILYLFLLGNLGIIISSLLKLNGNVNSKIAMLTALTLYILSIILFVYKKWGKIKLVFKN